VPGAGLRDGWGGCSDNISNVYMTEQNADKLLIIKGGGEYEDI
jgi:hypothetical protein